ncbi:MAG: nucleotide sugar dehydrogenase [Candidatus Altiarchaeales archaeon]|nr:MAG: nucleotide sugar dehydrogenase [Candidatus Altiarchaeales archaeon]
MKIYGLDSKETSMLLRDGRITISVYGLGKMGLPLAAIFADSGAIVIGADINRNVVDSVNRGINYIREEPYLDELVAKNVKDKRLTATTDLVYAAKKSDIQIIIVPTLIKDNEVDISAVNSVAGKISKGLENGDIVITECTMPPGSTESLIPILEKSNLKAGIDFGLAHCPERTMTGTAIRDIRGEYPKIVGCIDKKTTDAIKGIYSVINSKGVITVSNIKTAECVKVFEGIYRDVNIALANELTEICEKFSVSAVEAFKTANTQPYCHIHSPGAVGGHCIPVYPYFVMNSKTKLIRYAREINDSISEKLVNKALELLERSGRGIENANILVLGLSFRGGVKETINSPPLRIFSLLKSKNANIYCYDPLYSKDEIESFDVEYKDNFENIDCIIISTDHSEFRNLNWKEIASKMSTRIIIDGRQIVNPSQVRKFGFMCYSLGFI